MDVDAPLLRAVNDLLGENLAEGRDDDEVGREFPEGFEEIGMPDLLRLEHRKA